MRRRHPGQVAPPRAEGSVAAGPSPGAPRLKSCRVSSRPRVSATRDDVRPGAGATGRTEAAVGAQFTRGVEGDPSFFVDFRDCPDGPARAHATRLQGGDGTGEIFL